MNRSTIDLWVGIFVAAGLAALLFLALKVGNLASFSTSQTYLVYAKFANIGGLKGSDYVDPRRLPSGWISHDLPDTLPASRPCTNSALLIGSALVRS